MDQAVKKALMLVSIHPGQGGVDISTWRGGGLFISAWAFGDASNKIDSMMSSRFRFVYGFGGDTRPILTNLIYGN